MRCPRDQNKLSRKISEGVFGDCCDDCEGIFLSGKGMLAFKHNFETQILENTVTKPSEGDSNVVCPHCDINMNVTHVDEIEIDICKQCLGVWFDKTEAHAIIKKYSHENSNEGYLPFPMDLIAVLTNFFLKK